MKKFISLLLSLVLILSLAVPAFASEGEAADYDGYPIVVVKGIDFGGLYFEDGKAAIGVSLSDILGYIKGYISDRLIDRDRDAFNKNTLELVKKIFDPISNDKNGNSINTLYYDKYEGSMAEHIDDIALWKDDDSEEGLIKSAVEAVGYENVYFFTYDWRKSARELAGELNTFIDTALKETGEDKVNIAAVSMGGMVSTAYMYYHGNSKINNLTYISSAHNGVYSCGDCMNGNIHFDGDLLYAQVDRAIGKNAIMRLFVKLCKVVGIFDISAALVNLFVESNQELVQNEVLRNNFGTLMGFWAICPDDIFDSGVEAVFGGYEKEYPVLMDKIADTREFIFSTEEIIDSAIESGVKITFTSCYGSPLAPVYEKANQQGDGVVETYLTSNFATTSKIGKTLTKEQIAAADPVYLSPDKTVDATTALYKDVTWFIKDAVHVPTVYGSNFSDFALWLILADEQPTILTDEKYPQFMIADSEGKLLADK